MGRKKIQMLCLKNNFDSICKEINQASTCKVTLLAVSKMRPISKVKEAFSLGIKYFGENRVQEAEKKHPHLPSELELHFIGRLQSNKIKKAVKIFDVIETIDTTSLAKKINQQAQKINKKQRVYCQVNIGSDPKKTGFQPSNIYREIDEIIKLKHISLDGLMTILPQHISFKDSQKLYLKMAQIKKEISLKHQIKLELSMGMSADYILAIQCGATMVRIGTKLFGDK